MIKTNKKLLTKPLLWIIVIMSDDKIIRILKGGYKMINVILNFEIAGVLVK